MISIDNSLWINLNIPSSELRLEPTLLGGQTFYWFKIQQDSINGEVYAGNYFKIELLQKIKKINILNLTDFSNTNDNKVLGNHIYLLHELLDTTEYQTIPSPTNESEKKELYSDLVDFLNLSIILFKAKLSDRIPMWIDHDKRMKIITKRIKGLRLLKQNPLECLFSFLCSSNNHISRITHMVQNLHILGGGKLLGIINDISLYTFPTIEGLANISEETLVKNKYGYRARYIHSTAHIILRKGSRWLDSLKKLPVEETRSSLTDLPGIGRKIADCIMLYSLNFSEIVPIDVHMVNIAKKCYHKTIPSLSEKQYSLLASFFTSLWIKDSGWAQIFVYVFDLPSFGEDKVKEDSKSKKRKKPIDVS